MNRSINKICCFLIKSKPDESLTGNFLIERAELLEGVHCQANQILKVLQIAYSVNQTECHASRLVQFYINMISIPGNFPLIQTKSYLVHLCMHI